MADISTKPRTRTTVKTERPRLHKVILLNDDFTPREFVVMVLKAVFRMNASQAERVMITAHQKGACVVAVFQRDIAEFEGDRSHRYRQERRLPAPLHHRARGIGEARPALSAGRVP